MRNEKERRNLQQAFILGDYLPWNLDVFPIKMADSNIAFCVHAELICIPNGTKI